MVIDWMVVSTIAAPVIALFVGAALDRYLERKPKLIAYFSHASSFHLAGQNPLQIHTHAIVIKKRWENCRYRCSCPAPFSSPKLSNLPPRRIYS